MSNQRATTGFRAHNTLYTAAGLGEARPYKIDVDGGRALHPRVEVDKAALHKANGSLVMSSRDSIPANLLATGSSVAKSFDPMVDVKDTGGYVVRPGNAEGHEQYSLGTIDLNHSELNRDLRYAVYKPADSVKELKELYAHASRLGPGAERMVVFSDPRVALCWNGGDKPVIKGGASLLPANISDEDGMFSFMANHADLRFGYANGAAKKKSKSDEPKYLLDFNADQVGFFFSKDQDVGKSVTRPEDGSILANFIKLVGEENVFFNIHTDPKLGAKTFEPSRLLSYPPNPRIITPLIAYVMGNWPASADDDGTLYLDPGLDEIENTVGDFSQVEAVGDYVLKKTPRDTVHNVVIGTRPES